MFASVLVANRGEIACRVIRSARAMGIRTIAVYSDPDADSPHVAMADDAVALRGSMAADTYLAIDKLLTATEHTGAEAVHPGYGFLSENADFARACTDAGLVFVGPSSEVIAAMGDKVRAKERMRAAGVPVLPSIAVPSGSTPLGVFGQGETFPVIVKAAKGGGGKGMLVVERAEDLAEAVGAAQRQAAAAFGDDTVFIESYVPTPRHVEVQIFGDTHGNLVHLGERECSVQRRHQKVIEESPSPAVDGALRERITAAAITAARELGYTNAGTVEFILDPAGDFYFLEVNTRLQVEHPVTEMAWSLRDGRPLDLVRLQLLVAAGFPLEFSQDDVVQVRHAVEARIYAEDPANDFLPATGTLRSWSVPALPGVRVDDGVTSGSVIGIHYDPMLAKVVGAAPTRAEAVGVLASALERSRIHGVTTNRDFLVTALRHDAFVSGRYDTSFVSDGLAAPPPDDQRDASHAIAAALVQARTGHLAAPVPTLPPGWRNNRDVAHSAAYRLASDEVLTVEYVPRRDGAWDVTVGDRLQTVKVLRWPVEAEPTIDLEIDERRLRALVVVTGAHVDVDSGRGASSFLREPRFPDVAAEDVAGGLLAPMPGTVVSVHVEAGATVARGDLLLILEAMKMEHRVTAPHDGTAAEVRVGAGDAVNTDDLLIVLDSEPT